MRLTNHFAHYAIAILYMATVSACEHIDFPDDAGAETDKGGTSTIAMPQRTGKGTLEAPFTVTQLQNGADTLMGRQVWVIGYAVGEAYRTLSNSTFSPPFEHNTNVLIANERTCSTPQQCIPIELSTTQQKAQLSLSGNPQHHRHCLLIQGTVQRYFSTIGIRSLSNFRWFPNSTIIDSNPTIWEDITYEY